ncbi:PD-(D/E)XK nuclease family transposase [Caedimonas varicaedens]|uniref:PD-(D/E)XK nuclease family transposase n=1 Tax=Caedimonas varicaedens TaxID=1629334 RepID=A0A0K8MGP4_9PROT|nr:PD-(D/E)XK nuclease family transposase [Caedimonas varicaedens]
MTIQKFLDPKNDVAFKKIFGTEKNKDILMGFLNDMILFKEGKPIVEVSFLKTIQDPEISSKKTSVVDIFCTDENKNTYVVEMQASGHKGFEKRAQYYAAKAYCNQMNVGGVYENLKEVIFVAIANFTMFPDKKEYKSDHVMLDRNTHEHNLKDFSFTFLELGKFNKTKDQLSSMIEKWAYFFKHAPETTPEELKEIIGHDRVIERAYEELNRFYWTEEELFAYEETLKKDWDYTASMDFKFEEGMKKGIEKGIEKVAQALIKQELALEKICQATGLSQEQIETLM